MLSPLRWLVPLPDSLRLVLTDVDGHGTDLGIFLFLADRIVWREPRRNPQPPQGISGNQPVPVVVLDACSAVGPAPQAWPYRSLAVSDDGLLLSSWLAEHLPDRDDLPALWHSVEGGPSGRGDAAPGPGVPVPQPRLRPQRRRAQAVAGACCSAADQVEVLSHDTLLLGGADKKAPLWQGGERDRDRRERSGLPG